MPQAMNNPNRVNPGGARWCEQHHRFECTRNRTKGRGPCHKPAIRGRSTCDYHAGERRDVAKAKGAAITAWAAMGGEPGVEPGRAVLAVLHMTWLRLHLVAGLLEEQVTDGALGGVASSGDGPAPASGLIGHHVSSSPAGLYATGEALRGLAVLEAQERERVVRFAEVAHRMGIAEAQVRLEESRARMVAGALGRALDGELSGGARDRVVRRFVAEVAALEAAQGSGGVAG